MDNLEYQPKLAEIILEGKVNGRLLELSKKTPLAPFSKGGRGSSSIGAAGGF
jgi:hypothetical protein